MNKNLLLILLFSCVIFGCTFWKEETKLKPFVVNLENLNTQYDDYNASSTPQLTNIVDHLHSGLYFEMIFSSNRKSMGGDFDVWYAILCITLLSPIENKIRVEYIDEFYPGFNSTANEFGPIVIPKRHANLCESIYIPDHSYTLDTDQGKNSGIDTNPLQNFKYYFFASDRSSGKEGLDLYCVNENHTLYNFFLNTEFNEAYPCYKFNDYDMYYCADNEGNYDIYKVYNPYSDFNYWMQNGHSYFRPQKIAELSSNSDDKCPYIFGNIMVFTSDRPGGFGGFDIYYSKYDSNNKKWSSPKNFSKLVNSKYNEYRPSLYLYNSKIYIMIFSSDRQGGLGGYDLYLSAFEDLP